MVRILKVFLKVRDIHYLAIHEVLVAQGGGKSLRIRVASGSFVAVSAVVTKEGSEGSEATDLQPCLRWSRM